MIPKKVVGRLRVDPGATRGPRSRVIPANHKWVARTLVADILASTIRSLDLEYPRLTKAQLRVLAGARRRLERE